MVQAAVTAQTLSVMNMLICDLNQAPLQCNMTCVRICKIVMHTGWAGFDTCMQRPAAAQQLGYQAWQV